MIKAVLASNSKDGTRNGPPIVLLGLSHLNLDRLREGRPIKFDLSEIGLGEGECIIFADVDEKTITDKLSARFKMPGQ